MKKIKSPVQQAKFLKTRMIEHGEKHHDIAAVLSMGRSTITGFLSLVRLDKNVQELIDKRILSITHGKYLSCAPLNKQYQYAQLAIQNKLTSKQLWQVIKGRCSIKKTPDIQRIENILSKDFGTYIKIRGNGIKGKLEIEFNNLNKLDSILQKFGYCQNVY